MADRSTQEGPTKQPRTQEAGVHAGFDAFVSDAEARNHEEKPSYYRIKEYIPYIIPAHNVCSHILY